MLIMPNELIIKGPPTNPVLTFSLQMLGWILLLVLSLNFGLYALFQILCTYVYKCQDLKAKYRAKWALVTGSSSGEPSKPGSQLIKSHYATYEFWDLQNGLLTGIGKSLAWKLASQGLNIVLVSLPEPLLDATADELKSAFPNVEVRVVRWQSTFMVWSSKLDECLLLLCCVGRGWFKWWPVHKQCCEGNRWHWHSVPIQQCRLHGHRLLPWFVSVGTAEINSERSPDVVLDACVYGLTELSMQITWESGEEPALQCDILREAHTPFCGQNGRHCWVLASGMIDQIYQVVFCSALTNVGIK